MILLDTHAWLWWQAESRSLSPKARRAIENSDSCGVLAIIPWEIGLLVARGRLALAQDTLTWVETALQEPGVHLVPLEPAVAVAAAAIPKQILPDPVDRMLAAAAARYDVLLVTRDQGLRAYRGIRTVW